MRKKFDDLGKSKCFAKGGEVAKELKFMKDKGAPKSMIKAEKKEHGLPAFEGGGSSGGGSAGSAGKSRYVGHGAFNIGKAKAKPFAEGGSIDDATRERAMAWVAKRRAQQDAEGAGDASAAEPSPAPAPARPRAPAASVAPKPVIEQKTTTVYSNEGKGKAAPAAAKPAERGSAPGFAETIFNAIKPSSSASPGTAQLAQRAARTESAKRIAATKASADEEDANARPEGYKRGTRMRQTGMGPMPFAAGGSIDGCATKGKTRGKVV